MSKTLSKKKRKQQFLYDSFNPLNPVKLFNEVGFELKKATLLDKIFFV
jgi:hypothetical protein